MKTKLLACLACPSVHPHIRTLFPLEGFSLNFILRKLTKIIDHIKFCLKSEKLLGTLFEGLFRL